MKVAIVYLSMHHGNTKKLVDAIAAQHEVELIDADTVTEKNLNEYDYIGFASGIYGWKFHAKVVDFAKRNLPEGKKTFLISSCAMNKDFSKQIRKAIADRNGEVLGSFFCEGWNTFAFFGWGGGTGKGHPDDTDLANVVKFYEGIIGENA